jgi:hypothetical protein
MKAFVFFELFLVLFAFYAFWEYEGGMQAVVPFQCLIIAFLFERVRKRRRFSRYSTRLKAQYFLQEEASAWKECTVITAARKGMGITFHAQKKIDIGSTIHFAITVPKEEEPVMVKGTLKWIRKRKRENDFVSGIEFAKILDTNTFVKLSLRYSWEH